jgi:folate-binding protein YgfZ
LSPEIEQFPLQRADWQNLMASFRTPVYSKHDAGREEHDRRTCHLGLSAMDFALPGCQIAMSAGYKALRTEAAWLDVSQRGKILVTGEDRARLLHAMATNHIQQLVAGTGCYAFFLNAAGRVLADANIFCRPGHFLLDVEPELGDKVYQHLEKFIIADDVTLENVSNQLGVIALEGPNAAKAMGLLGAPVPAAAFGSEQWESRLVARVSITGLDGFRIFFPAGERGELAAQLEMQGVAAADEDTFRTVRLETGKPRYGEDITERYLAQEANQPHAIHFQKGCYLGQEIVERVRSRGQIHRVLMPLHIAVEAPPAPGTKLQVDGKNAAEIASSAYSPALGQVVALAYVRVEHAKPGTVLQFGATVAIVQQPPSALPPGEHGSTPAAGRFT